TIREFRLRPSGYRVLMSGLLLLIACSALAFFLMSFVPMDTTFTGLNTIREFRLRPSGYRVLMSGLLLFSVFLLAWLIINEGVWRRLSAAQAGVYVRSVFLKWLHRDLRMVTKRRLKRRLKRRRRIDRRSKLTATETIPNDSSETQHVHSDS
ncbi:MAG: hypothetical protein GY903_23335, partial [Fuerstiella sp.]|nr:hypothetical protein [Fuerstiella sp.]